MDDRWRWQYAPEAASGQILMPPLEETRGEKVMPRIRQDMRRISDFLVESL